MKKIILLLTLLTLIAIPVSLRANLTVTGSEKTVWLIKQGEDKKSTAIYIYNKGAQWKAVAKKYPARPIGALAAADQLQLFFENNDSIFISNRAELTPTINTPGTYIAGCVANDFAGQPKSLVVVVRSRVNPLQKIAPAKPAPKPAPKPAVKPAEKTPAKKSAPKADKKAAPAKTGKGKNEKLTAIENRKKKSLVKPVATTGYYCTYQLIQGKWILLSAEPAATFEKVQIASTKGMLYRIGIAPGKTQKYSLQFYDIKTKSWSPVRNAKKTAINWPAYPKSTLLSLNGKLLLIHPQHSLVKVSSKKSKPLNKKASAKTKGAPSAEKTAPAKKAPAKKSDSKKATPKAPANKAVASIVAEIYNPKSASLEDRISIPAGAKSPWSANILPTFTTIGKPGEQSIVAVWLADKTWQYALFSPIGKLESTKNITRQLASEPDLEQYGNFMQYFIIGVLSVLMLLIFSTREKGTPRQTAMPKTIVPAGLLVRFLAFLLDSMPFFILFGIILPLLTGITPEDVQRLRNDPQAPEIQIAVIVLICGLTIWWVIYGTLMEWKFGATLAKKLLKLKVLGNEGAPLSFRAALIRNITKPIEFFMVTIPQDIFMRIVGIMIIAMPAFSPIRQRLGDRLARTAVIDIRKSTASLIIRVKENGEIDNDSDKNDNA